MFGPATFHRLADAGRPNSVTPSVGPVLARLRAVALPATRSSGASSDLWGCGSRGQLSRLTPVP